MAQFPHEPATGAEGAARRGRAHAALRAHQQLDRTEAQQGVREDSGAAQHGGLHYRHTHAHTRTVRIEPCS